MSLVPGARLGPYEIVVPLGAGGMGEVYRAKDTKLGRDVALKLLPDSFTHDPDRVSRFRREAHVLATLNHPHIGAIYGIDEADGCQFLVLELVDGETLAGRLARGRLAVNEALPIATQIAEALEAAHEKGIIHRDLKPANVALTADGQVKVLDFGLAKAVEAGGAGGPGGVTNSPTLTFAGTQLGVILGTAAYMSPEQAKGRDADKRSDVWAYGCVLYEMLAGRAAFDGDDVSDILANILKTEPDWSALPPDVPPAIVALLRGCLEKDRHRRVGDIAAARFVLNTPAAAMVAAADRGTTPSLEQWTWIAGVGAATALVSALATMSWFRVNERPAEPPAIRFAILPPQNALFRGSLTAGPAGLATAPFPAVSPDGRRLAFVAATGAEPARLWIRELDAFEARELAGTDNAAFPFWSPDNGAIGFFADGKLKKVTVGSGSVLTLCDAPGPAGGTWSRAGVIVFGSGISGRGVGLSRISAGGGEPTPLSVSSRLDLPQRWPTFLPDGQHLVFHQPDGLFVADLSSSEPKRLTMTAAAESKALYAPPGYLLFLRQETLWAQPFDATRQVFTGGAVPLAEHIGALAGASPFSVSENGVLVFRSGAPPTELAWFDRAGKRLSTVASHGQYVNPALSPDGQKIAVARSGQSWDVWVFDLSRGGESRLTFDPGIDWMPVWSPDGREIAFTSTRGGGNHIYRKRADGAGSEAVVVPTATANPSDWSRDGQYLTYTSDGDLWVVPMRGDPKPIRYTQTPATENNGHLSPDGRWMAYQSNESGLPEVYVRPFPNAAGGRWQISTGGGQQPQWRGDGKELYYADLLQRTFRAVDVDARSTFSASAPRPLFEAPMADGLYNYAVAADGQRFLINVVAETEARATSLSVILNWTAVLKK